MPRRLRRRREVEENGTSTSGARPSAPPPSRADGNESPPPPTKDFVGGKTEAGPFTPPTPAGEHVELCIQVLEVGGGEPEGDNCDGNSSAQSSLELQPKSSSENKGANTMRPLNSGFVCTGHLLANKEAPAHFQTLRHFCTLIFCNLDDGAVDKSSGFWRYDQFFRSVEVGVESFAKFVSGILRNHETDEFELQLLVERLAWDMVKYDFDHLVSERVTRKEVLFRLFCVFNRLCSAESLPMLLPEKAAVFLLKEIGIAPSKAAASLAGKAGATGVGRLTLSSLLQVVAEHRDSVSVRGVKRIYDECVRDVIKEGRVKYRSDASASSLAASARAAMGTAEERSRTFTVTSRHLLVREDEADPGAALEQPHRTEPTGRVLHRLPLVEVETRVVKGGMLSGNKMFLQVLTPGAKGKKRKKSPVLEMVFDATKDQLELYSWSQAIQEGVYATQANTSRLDKLYHRLGLGLGRGSKLLVAPVDKRESQRRISAPESPPGFEAPEDGDSGNGDNSPSPAQSTVASAVSTPRRDRHHRPRALTNFTFEHMGRSSSETHLRVRQPSTASSSSAVSSASDRQQQQQQQQQPTPNTGLSPATSTTVIAVPSPKQNGGGGGSDGKRRFKKKKEKSRNSLDADGEDEEVGLQLISSCDNVTTVVLKPGKPPRSESKSPRAKKSSSQQRLSDLPKSFNKRISAASTSSSSEFSGDSLDEQEDLEKKGEEESGLWMKKNSSPQATRTP